MSDELIQRVLKMIATSKRIPLETVTIDSEFQQLGIDSMDAVEILFALENEFDISIPDEEVRSVRNVRQMCEGVERLLAAKVGGPRRPAVRACAASPSPAWARSAPWAGPPRNSRNRFVEGRSGIGPIESDRHLADALPERRRGARLQPRAVFRRPPRRFHGPLRAVRGDRGARGRGRTPACEWTPELRENAAIVTGSCVGGQSTEDIGFRDVYKLGTTACIR